jgi:hypothetical protein
MPRQTRESASPRAGSQRGDVIHDRSIANQGQFGADLRGRAGSEFDFLLLGDAAGCQEQCRRHPGILRRVARTVESKVCMDFTSSRIQRCTLEAYRQPVAGGINLRGENVARGHGRPL